MPNFDDVHQFDGLDHDGNPVRLLRLDHYVDVLRKDGRRVSVCGSSSIETADGERLNYVSKGVYESVDGNHRFTSDCQPPNPE